MSIVHEPQQEKCKNVYRHETLSPKFLVCFSQVERGVCKPGVLKCANIRITSLLAYKANSPVYHAVFALHIPFAYWHVIIDIRSQHICNSNGGRRFDNRCARKTGAGFTEEHIVPCCFAAWNYVQDAAYESVPQNGSVSRVPTSKILQNPVFSPLRY